MVPIHRAKIENGVVKYYDKQKFIDWWNSLKGEIEVIARPFKETRSDRQNRFYWAYLRLISEWNGDDENDLHEYFKRTHLMPRFVTVMKKEIRLPASTKKLKTNEFCEYIRKIEKETGILAPDLHTIDV